MDHLAEVDRQLTELTFQARNLLVPNDQELLNMLQKRYEVLSLHRLEIIAELTLLGVRFPLQRTRMRIWDSDPHQETLKRDHLIRLQNTA